MEQELRFGLDLGRLAVLKKKGSGPIMSNFYGWFFSYIQGQKKFFFKNIVASAKVIYPKYSKHWFYTMAHTINFVCNEMLNHDLNHGFFLSLFKLIPCPKFFNSISFYGSYGIHNFSLIHKFGANIKFKPKFKFMSKLYVPSKLNIDLILWHTRLIVCAVKY